MTTANLHCVLTLWVLRYQICMSKHTIFAWLPITKLSCLDKVSLLAGCYKAASETGTKFSKYSAKGFALKKKEHIYIEGHWEGPHSVSPHIAIMISGLKWIHQIADASSIATASAIDNTHVLYQAVAWVMLYCMHLIQDGLTVAHTTLLKLDLSSTVCRSCTSAV